MPRNLLPVQLISIGRLVIRVFEKVNLITWLRKILDMSTPILKVKEFPQGNLPSNLLGIV